MRSPESPPRAARVPWRSRSKPAFKRSATKLAKGAGAPASSTPRRLGHARASHFWADWRAAIPACARIALLGGLASRHPKSGLSANGRVISRFWGKRCTDTPLLGPVLRKCVAFGARRHPKSGLSARGRAIPRFWGRPRTDTPLLGPLPHKYAASGARRHPRSSVSAHEMSAFYIEPPSTLDLTTARHQFSLVTRRTELIRAGST